MKIKAKEDAEHIERIKIAQKSNKHPRLYYVEYDMNTGEIKYKLKKWYQWFSKKRIVVIIPMRRAV